MERASFADRRRNRKALLQLFLMLILELSCNSLQEFVI